MIRLFPSSASPPHHHVRCTFCRSTVMLWAMGAKHPPRDLVWDISRRLGSRAETLDGQESHHLCPFPLQHQAAGLGLLWSYRPATPRRFPPLPPLFSDILFFPRLLLLPSTIAVKVEIHAWQVTSDTQPSDTRVQKQCQMFLRASNAAIKMQRLRRQQEINLHSRKCSSRIWNEDCNSLMTLFMSDPHIWSSLN